MSSAAPVGSADLRVPGVLDLGPDSAGPSCTTDERGTGRGRTADLLLFREPLSQLSYGPKARPTASTVAYGGGVDPGGPFLFSVG